MGRLLDQRACAKDAANARVRLGETRYMSNFHEDLGREDVVKGPNNRKFGLTFAAVFALLFAVGLFREWRLAYPLGALALVWLTLALRFPDALSRLNQAWLKLGLVLNRIVSPVVMLVMYFAVIVPFGLLMRVFRKDLLRLNKAPSANTYWLPRTDPRSASEAMRQQF